MLRDFEYKLYPNQAQAKAIERWLSTCCWLYNQALEQRSKAYKRRGEKVTCYQQHALLTKQRERIGRLREVPRGFQTGALNHLDRATKAFFRRLKAGQKPGFPRFRSRQRFNSIEYIEEGVYRYGEKIRLPLLGLVRSRGRQLPAGKQKGLRILRRPTGWYAQIILNDGYDAPAKRPVETSVGIDVGLSSFATMSDGSVIANPRWLSKSARSIRARHRRMSRREKGSARRRKAIRSLAMQYHRLSSQRKNFSHQHSTALVRKYDLIAVEKLNVAGMVRSRFAKSILDAAWSTFIFQLESKAECAGSTLVKVDPRYSSQECPNCGAIKPKELSERIHQCSCGYECDRDHAAAQVILARAVATTAATHPWTDSTDDDVHGARRQVDRKRRGCSKEQLSERVKEHTYRATQPTGEKT